MPPKRGVTRLPVTLSPRQLRDMLKRGGCVILPGKGKGDHERVIRTVDGRDYVSVLDPAPQVPGGTWKAMFHQLGFSKGDIISLYAGYEIGLSASSPGVDQDM